MVALTKYEHGDKIADARVTMQFFILEKYLANFNFQNGCLAVPAGACGHADVIIECLLGLKCLLQKQYPF